MIAKQGAASQTATSDGWPADASVPPRLSASTHSRTPCLLFPSQLFCLLADNFFRLYLAFNYRTWVRSSLATNVIHSLFLSLLFSSLDWCDPCMWGCQLKTCLVYYCCWFWCWEMCWGQFGEDLEAEVWSKKLNFCSDFEHKVCSRFWCWSSGKILKLMFDQYSTADVL